MARLLITGATGFIGQNLVKALAADQTLEIFLLVKERYGMGDPLPAGLAPLRERCTLVFADLRNLNLTYRAVKEADATQIIHLAAAGSTDPFLNPHTAVRHNVSGTLNLIEAAFEKSGTTERLIVARTPGELTKMNPYAASKLAGWHFCQMFARTQGFPILGAMIFQCYGPFQPERAIVPAAVSAALKGDDFPMTAGTQRRDWIHVNDVIAGIQALRGEIAMHPGETAELGTGICISVAEVVQKIYCLTESQGKPLIGALPSRPGEAPEQMANLAETERQLNWTPSFDLETGLSELISVKKSHLL